MSDWFEILTREIEKHGSKAAVARKLDYARTTISLVAGGNYPGDTSRIAARVLEVFASSITCPHLQHDISREACDGARSGPMPTSSAAKLRHWTACQSCPMNTHFEHQRKAS